MDTSLSKATDSENNTTMEESNFKSLRRSSRKRKPPTIVHDSECPNDFSLSDEEEEKNVKMIKKVKLTKRYGSRCVVKFCQNKYPSKNFSFFGFPKNLSIRKIWIQNCGIEGLVGPNFTVSSSCKVCSYHFEDDMLHISLKKKRPKANAVPTIFYYQNSSQLLSIKKEPIDNFEYSSASNDTTIIEYSNSQNYICKQEPNNEQYTKTAPKNSKIHACCIPGCINSTNYSDRNMYERRKSFALFCPSSLSNMKDWTRIFGLNITMKSGVCENHFKPEDIRSNEITMRGTGLSKLKSLKYDALPLEMKKCGETGKKMSKNSHKDYSIKKTGKNSDKLKTNFRLNESSENRNIKIFNSDLTVSVLNSKNHSNNKSIDSQSSLVQILPEISANNSSSNSSQPIGCVDGLDQNKKHVELSMSQHNSLPTNLLSDFEHATIKKLITNCSLSVTVENINYQSAQISAESTELAKPTCKMKSNSFDVPQTISTYEQITDNLPPQSNFEQLLLNTPINNSVSIDSEPSIEENKQVPTEENIIESTILDSTVGLNPELIHEIPQTTNSFRSNVDNSLLVNANIAQYKPVSIQISVNDSQSNFKQPLGQGDTDISKSQFMTSLSNDDRNGLKNSKENDRKRKRNNNNQGDFVLMNNKFNISILNPFKKMENVSNAYLKTKNSLNSSKEGTVICYSNMNKLIQASKFGKFCEDFNLLHIIDGQNMTVNIPRSPTTQHSSTTKNDLFHKIEYLYQKYFRQSLNDNIVIIANILNIIILCLKRDKAKIKSVDEDLNDVQTKNLCAAELIHSKNKYILVCKFKKYFMEVISEFVDSEVELALKMIFLGILCVFKSFDQLKFKKNNFSEKVIFFLWNLIKKIGFKYDADFKITDCDKFRLDCINLINFIEDSRLSNPSITDSMSIFFQSFAYSKEYFQVIIDAVASHFHKDLAFLIDNAASKCCINSKLNGSMNLFSSSTSKKNNNFITPKAKTLNSYHESSCNSLYNVSTATVLPNIVPDESAINSTSNISNGSSQTGHKFEMIKPTSQGITTKSTISNQKPEGNLQVATDQNRVHTPPISPQSSATGSTVKKLVIPAKNLDWYNKHMNECLEVQSK